MRITANQLRRIIKEEVQKAITEAEGSSSYNPGDIVVVKYYDGSEGLGQVQSVNGNAVELMVPVDELIPHTAGVDASSDVSDSYVSRRASGQEVKNFNRILGNQ